MHLLIALVLSLLVGIGGPARAAEKGPPAALVQRLRVLLQAPALRHALVGLIIKDIKRQRVWYQQNAGLLMLPASNMKILTAACSLETLGPEFRIETRVLRTGSLKDGILTGSLYLSGGGDPALSTGDLQDLARLVYTSGIKEIRGPLVADESLFDQVRYNVGWSIDDQGEDYAMPIGALSLNRNVVHFRVMPAGQVGHPPVLQVDPPLALWEVVNEARTVPSGNGAEADVRIDRDPVLPLFWIRGRIPIGHDPYSEDKAVVEPAEYALNEFAEQLLAAGVKWQGGFGSSSPPEGAQPVSVHRSPPLRDLVKFMNKESDNHTAEQLLRLLGARAHGLGTVENGGKVVREWLHRIGGDEGGLVLVDGSGLSRRDYITPQNLLRVLEAMATGPHATAFRESLPVAGIDGTLKARFKGTPAAGRFRAKTGTMSHVSSLSGYLKTVSGDELAVVMIMNGFPGKAREVRAVQDELVVMLAGR